MVTVFRCFVLLVLPGPDFLFQLPEWRSIRGTKLEVKLINNLAFDGDETDEAA